jgi:outer membrane protein OmpA-like peptidoglycan-associated protein
MLRSRSSILAALTVVSALAVSARADDHFDVETFEPAPDQSGSVVNVYGARTLAPAAYSLSLSGAYGRKPLSIESPRGKELGELVGSIGTLQLLGAIGVAKHFDIGLGLPLHRLSAGTNPGSAPVPSVRAATLSDSKIALGDLRVVPRVSLYEHQGSSGFDLALLAPVWLPTGDQKVYAGESVRVEPCVALDYRHKQLLVAFNAGYLVRNKVEVLGTEIDDQLRLGGGAEIPVIDRLSVLAELDAHFNVLASHFDAGKTASEGYLGLRYRARGLIAQLGGGPGLTRAPTAPTYRLFATLGYRGGGPKPKLDSDADGLLDERDACPRQPEDKDGFDDADGCPDPDNDQDGVLDGADLCSNEREDRDGFADSDGCIDPDDDQDGVADAADQCAREAEDRDGFDDADGCPDPDNDADGVLDGKDRCPLEAGVATEQGCPAPPLVQVTEEKVELAEKIFFTNGSSVIGSQSFALLDSVAKALIAHTEISHLLLEGHTDDRGNAAYNAALSGKRAQAVVDALVARGVEPTRLSAKGFGASQPLVANDSAENRAKNRRVELRIESRTPATPAP